MDVAQEILTIIAEYKSLEVSEVTPEKSFEQLEIDSLDAIDIIYEIEDKFGIEIPTDSLDLQNTNKVADMLAVVQAHVASGEFQEPSGDATAGQ